MKIGVIGLGAMGRLHVQEIRKFPYVREILGCDMSAAARAAAKKDFGIDSVAKEPPLLAWKPDAIFVVTQPSTHVAVIEPALKAGIPVLTEKPLATTIGDCRRMVALAKRNKTPFQVGFELRYCGLTRGMRQVVDSGLIGKPLHVDLVQVCGAHRKGYMTRERTGGIFWEKLCHQVDFFRYWLGEPQRVMAVAAPNAIKHYGIEDNVLSCMVFPDGRMGKITFMSTRAAQIGGTDDHGDRGHYYEMGVTCTKGSVTYCAWTDTLSVVRFNHRKDCKSELIERIPATRFGVSCYDVASQNGDFLERVRAGKPLQFPASDALISMEWVAKAERSLASGGKWIQ